MSITLKTSKSADSKENIPDIQVDRCVTSALVRSGKAADLYTNGQKQTSWMICKHTKTSKEHTTPAEDD